MKSTKVQKFSLVTLIILGSCAINLSGYAGTFKHISIDGSFDDWAGIPPAFTRSDPDTTTSVAYKDIYVANDENYLYIRFTLFTPGDPFTSHENIFLDTDNNPGTGFSAAGGRVGSEMLIQSGSGYQEKNGGFNEGGINGLDWASGPAAPGTNFEVRISRSATYGSDSSAVFTSDTLAFLLEAEDTGFNPVEFAPSDPGGLAYTFEPAPAVLTTNLVLIGLADAWRENSSGTDLGSAWLDQAYDDTGWTSGQGLFGYTPTAAAYPPINTTLPSGPNTYYFRTHFAWSYETSNLVFVVTNYVSDGAVYYLNGQEVRRVRMPAGAVGYNTNAAGTAAPVGSFDLFGIPGGPLVVGDNIIEVETHQAAGSSQDMVFGLSLTAAAQFPVTFVDASQPADRSVVAGTSTTFSAEILGSGPLNYQWLKDGQVLTNATDASLTIATVLQSDAGAYALRVSNSISTNTTRAAVLTVTGTPVVITDPTQPADQTIVEGSSVAFSVAASGSAPLQYQWFLGTNTIPDATNATYTISSVQPGDAGSYHALVSNPINSTNSRSATLTVLLDKTPPTLVDVQGSPNQVTVTFSEPVDPATAGLPSNYALDGGVNVLSVATVPANPAQVTLVTSSQTRGAVYTLTVSRVQDLFGNPIGANSKKAFLSTVIIDGGFDDWQGLAPIYSGDSNSPAASNFKDVYVFNDANYIYFRVTTWDPTVLQIGYNNYFFDTDNDPATGYAAWGGAEMLIQGGAGYQEKNGGFNEGGINGVNWLCAPADTGTNFEFQISRAATYASDSLPVFTTNIINFAFDAENTSYQSVNRAPATGTLSYTLVEPPPLPPGPLAIGLSGGQIHITWTGPGTLQSADSLVNSLWTNVPAANNQYVVPATGAQRYFRLAQ
jgi:hypothetical protein